MLILAIDTSTRTGSLAILRDQKVLCETSSSEETPYSSRLFRDLSILRSTANFELSEVDVFAVAAGPGSFTGLRIGLTAVKAWAEVYQKPIAAISGLEAIAAQAKVSAEVVAPFMDARRGQVFGAIYRRGRRGTSEAAALELKGEEAILSVDEFVALVKKGVGDSGGGEAVLVSPPTDVLSSADVTAVLPNVRIETVSACLAPFIGILGFERAIRGQLIDAIYLDANYVRRSDAEQFQKGV